MRTKAGKRTAHLALQVVEEKPGKLLYLFWGGVPYDLTPDNALFKPFMRAIEAAEDEAAAQSSDSV